MAGRGKPTPVRLVRKDGSLSSVRPPFESGNTAALTHGARSERAIKAKAEEVHRELVKFAPWLDKAEFMPAVQRYLEAAGRERLLSDYITKVCATPGKGAGAIPVRLWESAASTTRLAAKLADDLGLSPLGRARLQVLAAGAMEAGVRFDLAQAWADSEDGDVVVEGAE